MKKGFTLVEFIVFFFVLVVVVIFGGIIVSGFRRSLEPTHYSSYRIERSLKQFVVNQGGVSGSFFLGCGSISGGGKKYYFYYKTKDNNKFRPAEISLTMSSIIEDGLNKIVFVTKPLERDKISELENEIDQWNFGRYDIQEFEFHIPPGSILEEYNPNLSSSN